MHAADEGHLAIIDSPNSTAANMRIGASGLWITLSAFEESPGKALGDVARRAEALGALLDELGVRETDRSTADLSPGGFNR